MSRVEPLLGAASLAQLRQAVARDYSSTAVADRLGLAGEAALSRGDLAGAGRLTRGGSETETLIRLFLLGLPVSETAAGQAIRPLPVADAVGCGLLVRDGREVRAGLDLRPYSEANGPDWWVVSDVAADVRPGPLDGEHVLGIGAAATTLAQSTVRDPVGSALDIGTGCGIQALHLSRHSDRVTATDLSTRALRMAATTAGLNGLHWDLRHGSFLEPVASEQYQLIVSNPPFIVGPGFAPGAGGFRYRDSGLAGDAVCERLIRELPGRLSPCGTGQLLANWIIGNDTEWSERIAQWLAGSGCDAWIWQREVAEPGEYVSLWLRDSGQTPGSTAWITSYDAWMDWFAGAGVMAVGMGLVSIRRTGSDRPTVVCEDVAQPLEQPIGPEIANWFQRADWLRGVELGSQSLVAAADLVRSQHSLLSADGWRPAITQLRQSHGMRWELEVDEAVAALVAACESGLPLSVVFSLLAATLDQPEQSVSQALLPVVGDLVQRGLLLPKL